MDEPPFQIDVTAGIVLVHGFERIHFHFASMERGLPILKEAMNRVVEQGHTAYVFDLRSANPVSAYPIVKWGAMYGVVVPLRRRFAAEGMPSNSAGETARNTVKLVVVDEEHLEELRIYKMIESFGCFTTPEEAARALRTPG